MENVEEQILSYPHLPEEEQREVEEYVEQHPKWAPLLRDVRALESYFRDQRVEEASDGIESLLSGYVVARHVQPGDESSVLGEGLGALEERLDSRPDLRERVEEIRRRLERVEARLDPVSHFEELTGHSLETESHHEEVTEPAVDHMVDGEASRRRTSTERTLLDEIMRLPLVARGIGALLVGLLGTYAVLFVLSTSTQSTLDRLSTVNISDQVVESYPAPNTRGAGRTSDSQGPTQLYLDALSTLRGARKSTLGLFPEYESDSLRKVETQLKQLVDRMEADAFLALEAQFYLGKVSLAQGELSQARPYFRTVVAEDGRRAEEAKKILKTLREDYPADGDDAR